MPRYIDADAAVDATEGISSSMSVCVNKDECHGMKRMQRQAVLEVANLPAADVAPVRHGRWIDEGQYADFFPHHAYRCSECGNHFLEVEMYYEFCPRCGAKMDGGAIGDPMEDDLK